MRRVAMRLVMDPDPSSSLAGRASSEEMAISPGSTSSSVFSRMRICQPPSGATIFALAAARQFQALAEGGAVERFEFGIERAARFVDDARQDSAQALHVRGVQVDVEDGRRQDGVVQRLETFAHVADDLQDDVSCGGGIGGGRTVHRGTNFDFNRRRAIQRRDAENAEEAQRRAQHSLRVLDAAEADVVGRPALRHGGTIAKTGGLEFLLGYKGLAAHHVPRLRARGRGEFQLLEHVGKVCEGSFAGRAHLIDQFPHVARHI